MGRRSFHGGLLLIALWAWTLTSSAQSSGLRLVSPWHSCHLDVRAGSVVMLSKVPAQYLDKLNNVNIPTGFPGVHASFAARKALTGHFEFGYQLNYFGLYGNVNQQSSTYRVHTQALENSYLFWFNLRRTDYYRPLLNYFVYYKVGAITLKNDPLLKMPDGSFQPAPGTQAQKFFFSNGAAVCTSVGAGINHLVTPHLSILGILDFSRSSDSAGDVFKVQKIFYQSSNTVNNYFTLSVGASYTFNLVKPKDKSSTYYKANSETEKRLLRAKIEKRKKRWARRSKDFWKK